MPYLDLSNPDNYVHLCQLFFAAHPAYRPLLDAGGAPPVSGSEERISLDIVREMAAWGRDRHLITRKDAARIVEHAEGLARNADTLSAFHDPASIVSLTPRVLGTPPRLQPSVVVAEIVHWLTLKAPTVADGLEGLVLTIPAAIERTQSLASAREQSEVMQARARQLLAWLQEQDER